ncbi:hypothetical protein CEXT_309651 [Caerostris extrusa]|uniref:Uncharacterized protein n=1 Tax=Caerostris extrusa TaxID=172846 RepID=A0AAV4NF80_CAEEX|nr:hypothetical protein CEXT_309651 [Caerostris extrusa]
MPRILEQRGTQVEALFRLRCVIFIDSSVHSFNNKLFLNIYSTSWHSKRSRQRDSISTHSVNVSFVHETANFTSKEKTSSRQPSHAVIFSKSFFCLTLKINYPPFAAPQRFTPPLTPSRQQPTKETGMLRQSSTPSRI